MENLNFNKVQFKGTFRDYQQKVLDNSNKYLKNKKIHIVAAPGSGKTKMMTDMSLTCEMMFRNQAKDIMDEVRNLFPNFRWDILRKQIDLNVKLGKVKSLVDVELFIQNNFKQVQNQIVLTNSSAKILKEPTKTGKYTVIGDFCPTNVMPT